MESCGFNPANECMVVARGSKPRAALLEGADRTTFSKQISRTGTTTLCKLVVLPQPPPPITPTRGKPKSLGNLRKVLTVAPASCLPCKCALHACSNGQIRNYVVRSLS